jgi:hypothetical protein
MISPGHLAVAFALKPAVPNVRLWILLVAAELLDLMFLVLLALKVETLGNIRVDLSHGVTMLSLASIPWSHGLFMSVIWSLSAAAIAGIVFRNRKAGIIIGLVVFSHWALDFIVHPPQLPLLFGGSPKVGLGLWTSGPGLIISVILELGLLAGGVTIYRTARRRKASNPHEESASS